jgi:hypothetical protein
VAKPFYGAFLNMTVSFGSANLTQILGQPNAVIRDKLSGTEFQATKGTAIPVSGSRLGPDGRVLSNNQPVFFHLEGTNTQTGQPVDLVVPFNHLGKDAVSAQLDVIA